MSDVRVGSLFIGHGTIRAVEWSFQLPPLPFAEVSAQFRRSMSTREGGIALPRDVVRTGDWTGQHVSLVSESSLLEELGHQT